MKRKQRVRVHLFGQKGAEVPSVEGLLLSRRHSEYVIGVPSLLIAVGGQPAELDSRALVIPREHVMFYEVLS